MSLNPKLEQVGAETQISPKQVTLSKYLQALVRKWTQIHCNKYSEGLAFHSNMGIKINFRVSKVTMKQNCHFLVHSDEKYLVLLFVRQGWEGDGLAGINC